MRKQDKTRIVLNLGSQILGRQRPHDLSSKDWKIFRDLQLLHACIAVDVLEDLSQETFVALWSKVLCLDPLDYLSLFQECQDWLLSSTKVGWQPSKLSLRYSCCLQQSLFSAITEALSQRCCDDAFIFGQCYQLFAFPLRVSLSAYARANYDTLRDVNSTRRWYEPDSRMRELGQKLINKEFCMNVMRHFRPAHGPGSISFTSDSGHLKTRRLKPLRKDALVDVEIVKRFSELAYMNEFVPCSVIPRLATPAKVKSVPKSWKKERLIAIESSTAMYIQQGLKNGFYYALRKDPWWRLHVNLERADLNGDLARLGSINRKFGTIDLSNASDSVGLKFAEGIFYDTPLLNWLRACRSDRLDINGEMVDSDIFASMGNAICFPVETMIFAILVEYARESVDDTEEFLVYGDDIVASHKTCEFLLNMLEGFGFTPNVDKTYIEPSCPFRESCGVESYNGRDVTPVRISRRFAGLPSWGNNEDITALVNLCNTSYVKGFETLYRFLCSYFVSIGINFPFSQDGSRGLIHRDPRSANSSYKSKWSVAKAAGVVKAHQVVGTPAQSMSDRFNRTDARNQSLALSEWLCGARWRDGDIEESLVTSRDTSSLGLHLCMSWQDMYSQPQPSNFLEQLLWD